MTIAIGRLSGLPNPTNLSHSPGRLSITGLVKGASLAELEALREELAETFEEDRLIAVSYTLDTSTDGFYRVRSGNVNLVHRPATGTGLTEYRADLERLGSAAGTRLQSLTTGKVLANDHSYAGSGSGFVAPPPGAWGYTPASTGTVTRAYEGGTLVVYTGVGASDNPRWSVTPGNYYLGACRVTIGGYVRAGLKPPHVPATWEMSNGIVKVSPGASGAIAVAHWDGTAWRSQTWRLLATAANIGTWESVSILRNDPERTVIRLAKTRASSQGRYTADIGVRRGSRTIDLVLGADTSTAFSVRADDAGTTSGMPTGTMKDSANDTNGHRWMVGSEKSISTDTANGAISKTATRFPVMVSKIISATAPATGDAQADLLDQYMAWRTETVREVRP